MGWGAGEGRRPGGRRCILARTPATCADGPSPPQPKHRLATGGSRYITSPRRRRPPPRPAAPSPCRAARRVRVKGPGLELSRAPKAPAAAGQPRHAAHGTARPGTPPPRPPAHCRRSPAPQKPGGVGVTRARAREGHPPASTSTPVAPKPPEGGGTRSPPPTPPAAAAAAAVTPRRPHLTHPRRRRRRRPLPREAGREPRGPSGSSARRGSRGGGGWEGGERDESWGRRLLPAKAVAAAPQLLGRWRRMERGGRGEERGRLGGPPPSSSPPVLPPTPLSLWPPGARCSRREGRRRLQGREGGSRPGRQAGGRAGGGAGAGGGGSGRREEEEEGGRRRRRRGEEEEAETLLGNRISATNSIHHQ